MSRRLGQMFFTVEELQRTQKKNRKIEDRVLVVVERGDSRTLSEGG